LTGPNISLNITHFKTQRYAFSYISTLSFRTIEMFETHSVEIF